MRTDGFLLAIGTLLQVASAWNSPTYSGYNLKWDATFRGSSGTMPSSKNWNVLNNSPNYNGEASTYKRSKQNIRYSGSNTLQIIPLSDPSAPGGWTSGRMDSKYTITPTAGKITRVEAATRLGTNPTSNKQGIWPAFWLLGDSSRSSSHPIAWPGCGEVDVMENINGAHIVGSTVHCDTINGGSCNEPVGLTASTALSDTDYHVWRVDFDRRSSNWKSQSIVFQKDGKTYHTITGSSLNDHDAWIALTQKPLFIILNVAVGGYYPGSPNSKTKGGSGSMMEVGRVSHYVSK